MAYSNATQKIQFFFLLTGQFCFLLIGIMFLSHPDRANSQPNANAALNSCQPGTTIADLQPGNPGVDFTLSKPMTRAELAAFSVKTHPWLKPFSGQGGVELEDVPPTHPNYAAIQVVLREGWMSPYRPGRFFPDATVNRDEGISVLTQALGVAPLDEAKVQQLLEAYPDGSKTRSWAQRNVAIALDRSLILISHGMLYPDRPLTLGEANQLLACQRAVLAAQGIDQLPQIPEQLPVPPPALPASESPPLPPSLPPKPETPWRLFWMAGGLVLLGAMGFLMVARSTQQTKQGLEPDLSEPLIYEVTETWDVEGSQKPLKQQIIQISLGAAHWFGTDPNAVYQPAETGQGELLGQHLFALRLTKQQGLVLMPGRGQQVYLEAGDRPLPGGGQSLLMGDEINVAVAGHAFRLKPTADPEAQQSNRQAVLSHISQSTSPTSNRKYRR